MNAIYAGVHLREHERTQLRLFYQWISSSKKELPLGFSDEHHEELRFLNTLGREYEHALERISDYDRWLKQELVPILEDFERYQRHL